MIIEGNVRFANGNDTCTLDWLTPGRIYDIDPIIKMTIRLDHTDLSEAYNSQQTRFSRRITVEDFWYMYIGRDWFNGYIVK